MPSHSKENNYRWQKDVPRWALGYIAGLIDGEGSICAFYRYRNTGLSEFARMCIGVSITNTQKEMLDFVTQWFGCSVKGRAGTKRPAWRISLSGGHSIKEFLIPLLPYLVGKQAQAKLALRIVDTFPVGRAANDRQLLERQVAWNLLRNANHYPAGNRVV